MRRSRGLWLALGLGMLLLAGAVLWQRQTLMAHYHLYQLDRVTDATREPCIEAVARLGEAALPGLCERLRRDDPTAAAVAGAALIRLAKTIPADDPRRGRLAEQVAAQYPAFSAAGQAHALDLVPELIAGADAATKAGCRELVRQAVAHPAAERRVVAVGLALRPDVAQLAAVAPLLHDPAAEVRRAAVLAVGPHANLVPDEDLIRWLHDSDPEVRGLCKTALRSRGLRERDVEMGRLLTHPDPLERMKLFEALGAENDEVVGVWLERLSQDAVPAVRAAAVRHGVEFQVAEFVERLRQMAEADPDESTRQLAGEYLQQLGQPRQTAQFPALFGAAQP